MKDERTDAIAREAARLVESGRAASIGEALRVAATRPGWQDVPRPGHGRVRQHLQAMSMQSMGGSAYGEMIREAWSAAEELMTLLDHALDDIELMLVGRAAKGQFDGGGVLHIRAYTRRDIAELAAVLATHGYEEPRFETADSRAGRVNRLRLAEGGHEIVITRCRPELRSDAQRNLFNGEPIATMSLEELRQRLSDPREDASN